MVIVIREISSFAFVVIKNDLKEEVYQGKRVEKHIDEMCFHFGKTLKGNREVVKKLLQIRQMVPICLYAEWQYVLFPIIDSETKSRIWLNYERIKCYSICNQGCVITFKNGYKQVCHISHRSLQRQLDRCFLLLYMQYCFLHRTIKKPSDIGELSNVSNLLLNA